MFTMARKKKSVEPEPEQEPERKVQTPFRPDDARLLDALDAFAHDTRRSRNMAMVVLIEEALKAAGYWPPPQP